ncbi:MAG: response regulator [Actinomycetota bacterium]
MRRILFVDDDAMVLDGLSDALRKDRSRWQMVFATSGDDALRHFDEGTFDVVVADVRMPGLDGPSLLAAIKEQHPGTARLVLSGQADSTSSRRLLSLAHQYLAKPVSAARIREVLDRTCRLRELLADERLVDAVGGVEQLPVVPALLARLDELLDDPGASIRDIADLVEADPGLSAKVIQLVSSAFFGLPRRITSLAEAVMYLGLSVLRHLVVSIGLMNSFPDLPPPASAVAAGVRERGWVTGALARAMAVDLETSSGDEAFLAGVVHDVGLLVLLSSSPVYPGVLAAAQATGRPLHAVESEVLGVTHGEVGAYLLGLWGLPTAVVEAVAHHHEPWNVPAERFDLPGIVYVAQALVWERFGPEAVGERDLAELAGRDYLQGLGVGDRLDGWRSMLDRLLDPTADDPAMGKAS